MASTISTTGLNASYPVAGVANDSSGFRTNFSVIKTGLEAAKTDIDDLYSIAVVNNAASDLGGNELSNLSLAKEQLSGFQFSSSLATGSISLDWQDGSYQYATTSASNGTRTISFSNFGTSGKLAKMVVQINLTASGSNRILFPTSVKVSPLNYVNVAVGTGSGFVQGVVSVNSTTGAITGITVSSGGTGFTNGTPSSDTVTITGGGGTGASFTATVSGNAVTGLNLVSGGSGYFGNIFGNLGVGLHHYEFATANAGSTVYLTNYQYYAA